MDEALANAEARRRRRLRGRGSLYLGRVAGTELFLPWLDWLVTALIMGLLLWSALSLDRTLERQGAFVMLGYLGAALMVQSLLYILGTLLAAALCRIRVAAIQLGPARRTGRFVTYGQRGRRMTLFYPLRSVPTLLGYFLANFIWGQGGSPLFAVIAQICLISVAFALLPIPGSDGVRTLQSIAWWLTGSVAKAVRWASIAALIVCAIGAWYGWRQIGQPQAGATGFVWFIAMIYLGAGVISHASALSASRKLDAVDATSIESLARPLALAVPGTHRSQYPPGSVVLLTDGARLLGQVDDATAVGPAPVDSRLLPCPALPVRVDPRAGFAETYLGMFDEGCDAVALHAGDGRYAALTLQDCAAFLTDRGIPYEGHLSVG